MEITYILLLLTVSFTITSCQNLPPKVLASIMQEILSQGSPEQAVQLIKGVVTKSGIPELTVNRRNVVQEAGLPRTIIRNEAMPKRVVVQQTNEMVLPRNVLVKQTKEMAMPTKLIMPNPKKFVVQQNIVMQNGMPKKMIMKKSNEIATPKKAVMQYGNEMVANQIIVKKPELTMPNKVSMKNPQVANQKILVQKANEIPFLKNLIMTTPNRGLANNQVVMQKNNLSPQIRTVSEINVVPEMVLKQPKMVEYVTQEKPRTVNPFLPAASPVSPLTAAAPKPNNMPQSRGQYLRKIPIPPPTI